MVDSSMAVMLTCLLGSSISAANGLRGFGAGDGFKIDLMSLFEPADEGAVTGVDGLGTFSLLLL